MREVEVEAKSPQEAIAIALKRLGVSRDKVRVQILSEEHRGLFGMGGAKPTKVKVILKRDERR